MRLRAALATACLLAVAALSLPTAQAAAAHEKHAQPSDGIPTVGALFLSAAFPLHICTASVVHSHNGDVIVTAAHCVRGGTAAGYAFAPGFHDGKEPYGVWTVVAGYGAPAWVNKTDVHDDFAFLRVAPHHKNGKTITLQSVTGSIRLGSAAHARQSVSITSYPLGIGGSAIHCRTRVFVKGRFRGFHCDGFADGTSGSAWVAGHGTGRRIVGILGGLHQGGCTPKTAYSSPLGRAAHRALARAGHGERADVFPNPPSDGCTTGQ